MTVKILNDKTKVNQKVHIAGAVTSANALCDIFTQERWKFEKISVSEEQLEKEIEECKDYVQNGILKFTKAVFFTDAAKLQRNFNLSISRNTVISSQ